MGLLRRKPKPKREEERTLSPVEIQAQLVHRLADELQRNTEALARRYFIPRPPPSPNERPR